MELNYQIFKKNPRPEQTNDLSELEGILSIVDVKNAKKFLNDILLDETQLPYYRKKSLELSAQLIFLGRTRVESVIDNILDIEESDDHFLLISAIKLSFRFYNCSSKENIINWLNRLLLHSDGEIRSEALYALGRAKFTDTLLCNNRLDFVNTLHVSQQLFEKSELEIDNRVDARFYKNTTKFLLKILSNDSNEVNGLFYLIEKSLWEYAHYSIYNGEISHFTNIVDSLSIIRQINAVSPHDWIDFKHEVNELSILMNKLDATLICNEIDIKKFNADNLSQIKTHIIDDILVSKFQSETSRLNKLLGVSSPKTKELVKDILTLINLSEDDKKKDEQLQTDLTIKLSNAFPNIPLSRIQNDITAIDTIETSTIITLFSNYINLHPSSKTEAISTGFSQGDTVLNSITSELFKLLPEYPLEKEIEFTWILRDVINYIVNAMRGSKSTFEFLFKPDALETELQGSMLTYLRTTERAGKYTPEVKEYADGGRVDINYSSMYLQIPIELKRSFEVLTWNAIQANYISQAQTYSYSRDQLSIFVVLDLSPQKANKPEASFRDLFRILHIEPRQNIDIYYPDYVVAFILPGNKMLPSSRSNYK